MTRIDLASTSETVQAASSMESMTKLLKMLRRKPYGIDHELHSRCMAALQFRRELIFSRLKQDAACMLIT